LAAVKDRLEKTDDEQINNPTIFPISSALSFSALIASAIDLTKRENQNISHLQKYGFQTTTTNLSDGFFTHITLLRTAAPALTNICTTVSQYLLHLELHGNNCGDQSLDFMDELCEDCHLHCLETLKFVQDDTFGRSHVLRMLNYELPVWGKTLKFLEIDRCRFFNDISLLRMMKSYGYKKMVLLTCRPFEKEQRDAWEKEITEQDENAVEEDKKLFLPVCHLV